MKFQIKHKDTNAVLHECEVPENLPNNIAMGMAVQDAAARGVSLACARLDLCMLLNRDLRGLILDFASANGTTFSGANMRFVSARGISAIGAGFDRTDMYAMNAEAGNFTQSKMRMANLDYMNAKRALFIEANMKGASVTNIVTNGAVFKNATLPHEGFAAANKIQPEIDSDIARRLG